MYALHPIPAWGNPLEPATSSLFCCFILPGPVCFFHTNIHETMDEWPARSQTYQRVPVFFHPTSQTFWFRRGSCDEPTACLMMFPRNQSLFWAASVDFIWIFTHTLDQWFECYFIGTQKKQLTAKFLRALEIEHSSNGLKLVRETRYIRTHIRSVAAAMYLVTKK